jgi:enamine deaminase RidA (YjgF/YER057c/UK114 family)
MSQAQADAIYDYADAVCKAAGTTMRNAVRADYFVTDIKDFPGIAMAWSGRYGDAPHPFSANARFIVATYCTGTGSI